MGLSRHSIEYDGFSKCGQRDPHQQVFAPDQQSARGSRYNLEYVQGLHNSHGRTQAPFWHPWPTDLARIQLESQHPACPAIQRSGTNPHHGRVEMSFSQALNAARQKNMAG